MKGWGAWVALGIAVGVPAFGLLALKLGLQRLGEEDAYINMRYILIALRTYAEDNSQFLPEVSGAPGLQRLLDTGVLPTGQRQFLRHPTRSSLSTVGSTIGEAEAGYYYLGGHRLDGAGDTIILVEKGRKGKAEGYVGLLDERTQRLRGEEWRQARHLVPGD
jgi:hypothetical protein